MFPIESENSAGACYTTPFGLTSQFCFCALPLRLDTYRGCAFRCTYCFARYRGGNLPGDSVRSANPRSVERTFHRALESSSSKVSAVGQFIRHRVPIHFGGMSDPLQPAELRFRSTEAVLQVLNKYQYPTVLSTKSTLVIRKPYIQLLRGIRPLVVQFSFSTTDDQIGQRLEPRCDPPSALLRAMAGLAKKGVHVTCRWQPFVPGVSEEPEVFVRRVASTGCKHLALEHLKLPLERGNPLWRELTSAAGRDLHEEYVNIGAVRDGREYVLPWQQKLRKVLEVARCVRNAGMTFGAADNEFQYLSDTEACCSGVDQFPGFENFFRHQIGYAIRKSRGAKIRYEIIKNEWQPTGSIDRYLNSKTRISNHASCKGSLQEHVLARWNSLGAPGSPSTFFGVVPCGEKSSTCPMTYCWSKVVG
jgi:DNA repair photolyase